MKQILVGTCIPGTVAEKWIPVMKDKGFECFAVTFHMSYGDVDIRTLGPKVRDMLEGKLDVEIHIEDIELTLLRIREQGGKPTDGMFVPAWVFRGYDKGTDSEGETRYGTVNMRTHIYASTESGIPMTPLEIFYDICPKERTIPVSSGRSDIYLAINAVDGSIIDLAKGY